MGHCQHSRAEGYPPIRIVSAALAAQQLLLAGLVGEVAAGLVTVLLGLQNGSQVDAGPGLLARVLDLLALSVEQVVPAVAHDAAHDGHVPDGPQAAGRDVALCEIWLVFCEWCYGVREGRGGGTNSVLDGIVASCGREVLWHGERCEGGVQAGSGSCLCEGSWSFT